MTQKFYKVTDSLLRSADNQCNEFYVQYIMNEWVKPVLKYSKLFVFNNLKSAITFASFCETFFPKNLSAKLFYGYKEMRIFECEVKNPRKLLVICNATHLFKEFWISRHHKQKMPATRIPAPKNTYQVDEIKLVQEIEKW